MNDEVHSKKEEIRVTPCDPHDSDPRCLILPSWAKWTFEWRNLSRTFLDPNQYGLGSELERCMELGYTVGDRDHELIEAPGGGGLIRVKKDLRRWFPAVLLRKHFTFAHPPGFAQNLDYRVHALVPKIAAFHRLGEKPISVAPSPVFSLDPIIGDRSVWFVAMGFDPRVTTACSGLWETRSIPGASVEPLAHEAAPAQEVFERIPGKQLLYKWYAIRHDALTETEHLAALLHLGLDVAGRTDGSLRAFHIFSPELKPGIEYPSATSWKGKVRRIRYVSDW